MFNNIIKTLILLLFLCIPLLLLTGSSLSVLLSNIDNDVRTKEIVFAKENFTRNDNQNVDDVINEKNFIQGRALGNCCLVSAMATLPSNAELYDKVVPPVQNFRMYHEQKKTVFHLYKLGKLYQVTVDANSLPRTNSKLVYSTSANDHMVCPLLE